MWSLKKLIGLFSLFLVLTCQGQSTDWKKLVSKAETENRRILLVFSGSDWCRGCMIFEKEVLIDQSFQQHLASNWLYYKADFPRKKKNQPSKELSQQNEKLIKQYNPRGVFPFVVILDANLHIVHSGADGLDKASFLPLLASLSENTP